MTRKLLFLFFLLLLAPKTAYAVEGVVDLDLSGGGQIIGTAVLAGKMTDSINASYYLDPAADPSLIVIGSVGIGTIAPSGILSVTPTQYSTGTVSQSLTTVTGVDTTFTSAMVGSQLVYANGVSAGTITAFTNITTLTVSTSQTVTSQAYNIAYTGLEVGSTGLVGIGTTAPLSKLSVNGGLHIGGDSDAGDNNLLIDGTTTSTGTLVLSNNTITCTGCIETTDLLDSTILTGDIALDTILAADIAAGAVGASEIADGTVGAADIAADAITASEIATSAVATAEILDSTILTGDIALDTILAADIAANIIGDSELMNGGTWNITSDLNITGAQVGIGVAPTVRLHVSGNDTNYIASFNNVGGNLSTKWGIGVQSGTNDSSGTNVAMDIYDGDGTKQGAITFTSGTVTYGAFTANHDTSIPEEFNQHGYPYGTLLCVDKAHGGDNVVGSERLITYQSKACDEPYSNKVLGAYAGKYENEPNLHQVYILGDGQILVNGENGDIKIGDSIVTSSTTGIGTKAISYGTTIGRAQEDYHFTNPSETKLLAVQYGLGYYIPDPTQKLNELSDKVESQQRQIEELQKVVSELKKINSIQLFQ